MRQEERPHFTRTSLSRILLYMVLAVFLLVSDALAYEYRLNLPPYIKYRFGHDASWAKPDTFDGDWAKMALPNRFQVDVPPGYNGSIWYRLKFILPKKEARFPLKCSCGDVIGQVEAYLNGTKLVTSRGAFVADPHRARDYASQGQLDLELPPELLRPGEINVLALRVSGTEPEAGSICGNTSMFVGGFCIRPITMNVSTEIYPLPTDPRTGLGGVRIDFGEQNWSGQARVIDYYGREVGARRQVTLTGSRASVSFRFPVTDENWHRVELTDILTGENVYRYFRCGANTGARPVLNISGEWQALPVKGDSIGDLPGDAGAWRSVYVPQWYRPAKTLTAWPREIIGAPGSGKFLAEALHTAAYPQIPGAEEGAHRAWFRKRFEVPNWWSGKTVELTIGANRGRAIVYVNGERVGQMNDPFARLRVDITKQVRFGEANELLMAVQDVTAYVRDDLKPGPDGTYAGYQFGPQGGFVGMAGYPSRGGGGYTMGGPWQEVFVRGLPPLSVADVFVIPRVSDGKLAAEIMLANRTQAAVEVQLLAKVYRAAEKVADLGRTTVPLSPSETKVITVEKPVKLVAWDLDDPVLHRLEATLLQDEKVVDVHNTRFGYRQITTNGTDFVLNGKPIHFFRTDASLAYYSSIFAPGGLNHYFDYYYKRSGANSARVTVDPPDPFIVEVADDVGYALDVEGCWSAWQANDLPEFWENARQHWRGITRRFRNNPSVLLYSLANEAIHPPVDKRDLPESVYRAAKAVDPTRLYGWDDDTDYLRETMDYICVHYPQSPGKHSLWPDSAFWWQTPMPVRFDRNPGVFNWKRDKPVMIGEVGSHCYAVPPHGLTTIQGPDAYLRSDLGTQDWIPGRWAGTQGWLLAHWQTMLMSTRGARLSGVSGTDYMQTTQGNLTTLMEPVCALLREMDHTFYAGEEIQRTFAIFNGLRRRRAFRLMWRLTDANGILEAGAIGVSIPAGGRADRTITLAMPAVGASRQAAAFEWELRDSDEVVYRDEQAASILPRARLTVPANLRVGLYDPSGATAKALKRMALSLPRIESLKAEVLTDLDLLVIGEDGLADEAEKNSTVLDFARGGGRVTVLHHNSLVPPVPVTLQQEGNYEANTSFITSSDHPVLVGLAQRDFCYWRGRQQEYPPHLGKEPRPRAEPTYPLNHRVCTNAFIKPTQGSYRMLLESGGVDGTRWTPLIEFPVGDGSILLCQLLLADGLGCEPVADRLLANIMDWAGSYKRPPTRRLIVWAPRAPKVLAALRGVGVPFTEAGDFPEVNLLGQGDILLVDGGEQVPSASLAALETWLKSGGTLWAHGLRPLRELVSADPETSGLVGWWRLDETNWVGATAADSSARGNSLTPAGSGDLPSPTTWANGRGAWFEASDRAGENYRSGCYFAAIPDSSDLRIGTADFTLEAWVNPADLEARSGIAGAGVNDYCTTCYGLLQRSGKYHFIVNGASLINGAPNAVTTSIRGGWHLLAGVRRQDELSLYIDGELVASGGRGDVNPDEDGDLFLIGAGDTNNNMIIGAFFKGEISEVRLYKGTALTGEQIRQRYRKAMETQGSDLGAWSRLLPEGLGLRSSLTSEAVVLKSSGLAAGLSNFDLYLRRGFFMEGSRDTTVALTNLIWYAVTGFDGIARAESYLEPAGLVRCPVASGALVIDQLAWEEACLRDESKGYRIISALATNLGLPIAPEHFWRGTRSL